MELKELREKLEAKHARVNEILDANPGDEMSNETYQELDRVNKEANDLEHQVKEAVERGQKVRDLRGTAKNRDGFLNDPAKRPNLGGDNTPGPLLDGKGRTLGETFTKSEDVLSYLKTQQASDGRIPQNARITTPSISVDTILKTLVTGAGLPTTVGATSAGALTTPDFQPGVVNASPFRPLVMRDLLTPGQTTSDLISFVRINGYTNNAAPVPEATATAGTSGTKPESGLDFVREEATVKTLAHWIPITRQALADAAQVRTFIDAFLARGVEEVLENQVLTGNGLGENFRGILNTPGIQSQAYVTNLLTTVRKARTKAKTPGRVTPNALVMHPSDWETFDLQTSESGVYYFGGPAVLGNPRVWGLPVVECEAMTPGRALLGDFSYATLWDRMAATLFMTDSHADFFTRNLIAILCEMRAAFAVLYPKAFVEVDLTAGP